mgnify:CR=1 FL=1
MCVFNIYNDIKSGQIKALQTTFIEIIRNDTLEQNEISKLEEKKQFENHKAIFSNNNNLITKKKKKKKE